MRNTAEILRSALEKVRVGPPLSAADPSMTHVTVYPLLPASLNASPSGDITLSDGRTGGGLIDEVCCEDAVRVSNPFPVSLFGGESECLVGRTQNRALKHDVVIPPRTSRLVLVNCVERGQPTRAGKGFAVDAVCPWSVRLDKMRQLAIDGRIDQGRVWDRVDAFLKRAGISTPTEDLCAAFDAGSSAFARTRGAFPYFPGQVGVMCTVGHHVFLDLFQDPEIMERRMKGILSSALAEGIVGFSDARVPPDVAERSLEDLLAGTSQSRIFRPRFSSAGDREVLVWNRETTASAFVTRDGLRHLAAHWVPGRATETGDVHLRRLEEFRHEFLARNRDWLLGLREAYLPRRQAYTQTVAELSSEWAVWRREARLLRAAAGPSPGPLIGTDEEAPSAPLPCPGLEGLSSEVSSRISSHCDGFAAELATARTRLDRLQGRVRTGN